MIRKSCRQCGRPGLALCETCAAHARRAAERARNRPSRQARGYDAEYVRNRNAIVREVCADILNARCYICGRGFIGYPVSDITAEHVTPLRNGGTSARDNLAPAHARCNYGWRR